MKQNWNQTVAQLTAHYGAGPNRNVSNHIVKKTLLDMGLREQTTHSCASADQVSSTATPTLSSGTSRVEHGSGVKNCLVRQITLCHSSRQWPCQDMPSSRWKVVPLMYNRSDISRWLQYYALGDVLLCRDCGRGDNESYGVSVHHCGSVAPVHSVCLPKLKWNVPTGECFLSRGSNCVGVVPGTWCSIPLNVLAT